MEKLLTISIAAYNVGDYILNNLNSLVVSSDLISKLEVFIVDDGGKDETLSIAKEFAGRYPDIFYPIHKDNGGYGSTVNYSLKHARGKYFRLLDGDDWFNTEGLEELLKQLEKTDSDVVVTNFLMGPNKNNLKLYDFFSNEGGGQKQLAGFIPKTHIGMWALTFKTDILRQSGLSLPEHELYTDQYLCTIPFKTAKTIQFFDISVYCYRTDRDGQSTSKTSRIKHYKEAIKHSVELTEFCASQEKNQNYPYILKRVANYHSGVINTLILMPVNKESLSLIKEHEAKIKRMSIDVYKQAVHTGETGLVIWLMRHTWYLSYWLTGLLPKR